MDCDDRRPVPCIVDEGLATRLATMLDHLIDSDEVRRARNFAGETEHSDHLVVQGKGSVATVSLILTKERLIIDPRGGNRNYRSHTLSRRGSAGFRSTLRSWRTSLDHAVDPGSMDAVSLRSAIESCANHVLAAYISAGAEIASVVVGRDEQEDSLRAAALRADKRWWDEYVDAPLAIQEWLGSQIAGHRVVSESDYGLIGEGCIATRRQSDLSTIELMRVLSRMPDDLAEAALELRPQA